MNDLLIRNEGREWEKINSIKKELYILLMMRQQSAQVINEKLKEQSSENSN